MINTQTEQLTKAVESLNIQNSRTLDTVEIGSHSLLTNNSLESDITSSGTVFATQNNLQLSDISRVKDHTDLMEVDWTYKTTTSKPFIQSHTIWASSKPQGFDLIKYSFPRDYFISNHVLQNVGQTFLSMRGDLHFVITVQGSPMLKGAIIAYPIYTRENPTVQPYNDINSWFFRQHVIVDVSDNSSTADLIIPYKHYRNGIDPFDTIFDVYVTVLSPLQGLSNVSVTITAFLENQEFKFIRPRSGDTRITQGLINVTNINNTLSDITNATLPTNMTGDSLTVKGMDDIGVSTNPSAYLIKFNSLNNSENPHSIDKISLNPSTMSTSTTDTFNTKIDEMSLRHIMCERDHYLTYGTISTTIAPSDPIYSTPLMPTIPLFRSADASYTNVMTYLTDSFKFWRGGLKFKIKFFMNRFQSMKFYLGLFYKAVAPTAFTDFSSSHGVVFDIGGDVREIEVEIPYNSETAWLHVLRKVINIAAVPTEGLKRWYDYMLGTLNLYALSPLISPDASNIAYVITMSGADDFELANYCTSSSVVQGALKLSKQSIRTPGDRTDVISNMKEFYTKWQRTQGIRYHGVTTRNSLMSFYPANILDGDSFSPVIQGVSSDGLTNVSTITTRLPMDKVSMYAAYRGGIKIRVELKVVINPDLEQEKRAGMYDKLQSLTPVCMYFNSDNYNLTGGVVDQFIDDVNGYLNATNEFMPTPYLMTPINSVTPDMSQTMVYEFEVPYQRNTKFYTLNSGDAIDYGIVLLGYTTAGIRDPSIGIEAMVYTKIADDGRFGILNWGGFVRQENLFSLVSE